jgi:hypothetical protein
MCASLASELLLFEFYSYTLFKSSAIIDQCPVNPNILALKVRTFQVGFKIQNGDFLEKVLTICIKFQ